MLPTNMRGNHPGCAFHDAILAEGGLPLTLLDARIDSCIDERRMLSSPR